jgi:hypothetical protein
MPDIAWDLKIVRVGGFANSFRFVVPTTGRIPAGCSMSQARTSCEQVQPRSTAAVIYYE